MSLAARIQGVGLVGPGFASWSAGRAMLAGSEERADNPDPGLEFAVPADVKQVQLLVRDLHRAGFGGRTRPSRRLFE